MKEFGDRKNYLLLIGGSVLAQVLNFVFIPIVTRIYSKNDIGLYTLVLSYINIFSGIVCARFDILIVSARNDDESSLYTSISFIATLVISAIAAILFFLLYGRLGNILFLTAMVFLFSLFQGIVNIVTAANNYMKEYRLISVFTTVRAGISGLFQILSGFLHLSYFGLLASNLLSMIVGLPTQARSLIRLLKNRGKPAYGIMLEGFRKNLNQLVYSVPSLLVNSASYSLIPLMIVALFDLDEVGNYSVSLRLLGIPLSLVSANISKIYMKSLSEKLRENGAEAVRYLVRIVLSLSALSFAMALVFSIWGEEIIILIFGAKWRIAGTYLKLLTPMFGIRLVISSISTTFIIVRRQKLDLGIQVLFLIALYAIFMVLKTSPSPSMNVFLGSVSVAYSAIYLLYGLASYHSVKNFRNAPVGSHV